jgi:hypothetical protein
MVNEDRRPLTNHHAYGTFGRQLYEIENDSISSCDFVLNLLNLIVTKGK